MPSISSQKSKSKKESKRTEYCLKSDFEVLSVTKQLTFIGEMYCTKLTLIFIVFMKFFTSLRHYILSFWAYASTFLHPLSLPSQRHRKKKSTPASQLSVHLDSLSRCMVMYAIITSPLLAETTKVGCKWHCLFCYPFFLLLKKKFGTISQRWS